jgi:gamma-glutamyltranspeptidase / glutathione hydrolase
LTADMIVEEMRRGGGIVTAEDLRGYEAKYREPLRFDRGEYEFITHPMPSSGGVTLAQILGLIDLEELRGGAFNSADYVGRIVEAERLAYADRNYHLGDSDFVKVPVYDLISEAYLSKRREEMAPGPEAGTSAGVSHGRPEGRETTHYCVADAAGNVVSMTVTLNAWFGMGAVVDGAGFLLNNEMDDFSAKPGVPNLYGLIGAEANAIAPGKRMLSSMTPTIVTRHRRFHFTAGSPGGSTIITTVLQIFLNKALWGMNIRDAIDAGRFHHQWLPDQVYYERRALGPETLDVLEARGYTLVESDTIGVAAGIEATPEGYYAGWADRRGPGVALGY